MNVVDEMAKDIQEDKGDVQQAITSQGRKSEKDNIKKKVSPSHVSAEVRLFCAVALVMLR
jgi:hypothetical protein